MIQATYHKHLLNFKQASGTSRGILRTKETWFIILKKDGKTGIGECGLFRGLSIDDVPSYEEKLQWFCANINQGLEKLLVEATYFPSIQFGLEQAFLSLKAENPFELFPSNFTNGTENIPINGLIWMGDKVFMQQQIKDKLQQGFNTIKMKIGAIDFETEIGLLKSIRKEFSSEEITLRVDANGGFTPKDALQKLQRLSELDIHSIEQPIKQGQWQEMANLCEKTPLPIALDEELIGVFTSEEKEKCIQTIKPQYIILKPSLVGGFKGSEQWISIAKKYDADNWITSALESNIGLNAIAQFTQTLKNPLPQGLGTGSLFTNNFESPLEVSNGSLGYNSKIAWEFNLD
ncbi:o-succinylbenzoate synthase [Tenacibaculum finnmarkense genomovar finnmarkense]|uniref:o-succinylbenzoate synthase n=1 Tax=Tenacibaculum finnmarkense TaxID=2781243 RepID=UPI001E331292|nr:o-succinylbenzoate synthase [Tenacibaculum finnmarkense]MCD8417305.1 o-succinylbenzoate synthase [Tenacibaculum finnmarkense genomovar finnmarkense]MCG8185800.1 o-succinylbenzoate synthase [Tenacibaculum finnmarkense genomovar finnmarkense]MCG8202353.1 o-succinylbenzoate synthase [Tenacibaculum finnmarkense genomovar finnmarkense]MCG8209643.1 o-succinylbenzoate synthase [Tenacibaculum finnmarkense genomovar finnmarkense]MCG8212553.1 o-succinylbenzoate synthase [Tenacibaculum finnmarkense ge